MERQWLLLCDCTARILARRQLGEDDARQCVKAMLRDQGDRLHVQMWDRHRGGWRLLFRCHLPDFRWLRVDIWPLSIVSAEPYGDRILLKIDRADFMALLDELCPEKSGKKSGTARTPLPQLRTFLLRPDISCLRRKDQWQKAIARFGRDKLTEALFGEALPEKRQKGRRKIG
jgi:hypothetical protein